MARLRALGIAAGLLLLSPVTIASSAQEPLHDPKNKAASGDPFTDDFGKFVTKLLDEWKVPGVSIAVVDGEDVHAQVGQLHHSICLGNSANSHIL